MAKLKTLDDLKSMGNFRKVGEMNFERGEYISLHELKEEGKNWLKYMDRRLYDSSAFIREFFNIKYGDE